MAFIQWNGTCKLLLERSNLQMVPRLRRGLGRASKDIPLRSTISSFCSSFDDFLLLSWDLFFMSILWCRCSYIIFTYKRSLYVYLYMNIDYRYRRGASGVGLEWAEISTSSYMWKTRVVYIYNRCTDERGRILRTDIT